QLLAVSHQVAAHRYRHELFLDRLDVSIDIRCSALRSVKCRYISRRGNRQNPLVTASFGGDYCQLPQICDGQEFFPSERPRLGTKQESQNFEGLLAFGGIDDASPFVPSRAA